MSVIKSAAEPDSVVGSVTRLRAGQSGLRFPVGTERDILFSKASRPLQPIQLTTQKCGGVAVGSDNGQESDKIMTCVSMYLQCWIWHHKPNRARLFFHVKTHSTCNTCAYNTEGIYLKEIFHNYTQHFFSKDFHGSWFLPSVRQPVRHYYASVANCYYVFYGTNSLISLQLSGIFIITPYLGQAWVTASCFPGGRAFWAGPLTVQLTKLSEVISKCNRRCRLVGLEM
jgi:hypothetical protein